MCSPTRTPRTTPSTASGRTSSRTTTSGSSRGSTATSVRSPSRWCSPTSGDTRSRTGPANAEQPTLLKEQQADCFAGAWTKRVADGDAEKIKLKGGNLDGALAAMIQFRDPVGTGANEEGAHGSGFDRTNVFQTGFDGGAEACVDFFTNPPPVVEIPLHEPGRGEQRREPPAEQGPARPRSSCSTTSTRRSNRRTRRRRSRTSTRSTRARRTTLPKCGGTQEDAATVKNRVFYCIDDGNFGFEDQYLQHVYDDIGDFGVSTLHRQPVRDVRRDDPEVPRRQRQQPTTRCSAPIATPAASLQRCSTATRSSSTPRPAKSDVPALTGRPGRDDPGVHRLLGDPRRQRIST